jgi:hypothetical protein
MGDLGKRFLCQGRDGLGHHRKELAGSHPDQRQEVLDCFLLALGFGREFAQMFHHGVGINLADGTDLVLALEFIFAFVLIFAFEFVLALAEQAAGDVAEGAEPAFAFQAGLIFHFQFAFHLVLEFAFELVFQFSVECHDESSVRKVIELKVLA